jgi:hypothetical protein
MRSDINYDETKLKSEQLKDHDIAPIIKWLEKGTRPYGDVVCSASAATRHYWNYWNNLILENGVLYRKFLKRDNTGDYLQLIVPRSMREEVLYQCHSSLLSGHLGRKKTQEKLLRNFYWFGVREGVNIWIARCDSCASIKTPLKPPRAPLGTMPVGDTLHRYSWSFPRI